MVGESTRFSLYIPGVPVEVENFEREECQNISQEYYSQGTCPLVRRRGATVTLSDLTKVNQDNKQLLNARSMILH